MSSNFLTSAAGALLVTIGTFLPWINMNFFGMSVNGWSREPAAPIALISCAVVGALLCLIPKKWINIFPVLCGLLLTALGMIYIYHLYDRHLPPGSGIWLIILGGITLLIGGLIGLFNKKTKVV